MKKSIIYDVIDPVRHRPNMVGIIDVYDAYCNTQEEFNAKMTKITGSMSAHKRMEQKAKGYF